MLERKSLVRVVSAREMASLADYFSCDIDPQKVRRQRSSDLWGDPEKAPNDNYFKLWCHTLTLDLRK